MCKSQGAIFLPKTREKEGNTCIKNQPLLCGGKIALTAFIGVAGAAVRWGMSLVRMPRLPSNPLQTRFPASARAARMGGIHPASAGVPAASFRHSKAQREAGVAHGMPLDYFYGQQAEQFSFYRVPKAIFSDKRFDGVSTEAKLLYGILLDRMSLSQKNNWLDDMGRVYIIFTLDEVMQALGCADNKATKLMAELENKASLIERKRRGLGKPNLIYLKNFATLTNTKP